MRLGVNVGKIRCRAAMADQEDRIMKELRLRLNNDSEGVARLVSKLTMDDPAVTESRGAF
jgi:hypothetical protein